MVKTHILDSDFGIEKIKSENGDGYYEVPIDINSIISELAEDLPRTSYMDMLMVFTDIYETKFGIYDHMSATNGAQRPLVSVALHEAENLGEGSDLYNFINTYFDRDVLKYTGLNLEQFGKLPREYINLIIKNIEKIATKEAKILSNTDNILNNSISRKK